MSPFALPIRRPVATTMFFVGVVLLGLIAWRQMPVELLPNLAGNELIFQFNRPGSEPEIVEREILLPLGGRVSELALVAETWGEVRGSGGSLRVRFERGADLKVRELEMQQIAAELARQQPRGTTIDVQSNDFSFLSQFAMVLQVTGGGDENMLHDLIEERITPRLSALNGVGQVITVGGSAQQVTVEVDPDRCTAAGIAPEEVIMALQRATGRLRFLGNVEDSQSRTAVVLDGRPQGVVSLASIRVRTGQGIQIGHVADVRREPGQKRFMFRVNGEPSVGLIIFQEQGANLVRLGRDLRQRIEELRAEFAAMGIGFQVSVDGADVVEEQIDHLQRLAVSGFLIALVVLYLFLRQWRAVMVVAVAVPVSLLAALALLFLGGQSLNLISLFGLAVGIGLLVDNSVVVYEAVQRALERGHEGDEAAVLGVRRTVRAIIAASATTGVVFLPLTLAEISDPTILTLLEVVALAILLPLLGSLLVAVGLVPLLARRLAAPAAMANIAEQVRRRRAREKRPVDRIRGVFSGLLMVALRRPAGWLAVVIAAVFITLVGAPIWLAINTGSAGASQVDQVQMTVRLAAGRSLEAATSVFSRLEESVMAIDGVERVESTIQEGVGDSGGGTITTFLVDQDERPRDLSAGRIRRALQDAAEELRGVEVLLPGEGDGGRGGGQDAGGLLGQAPGEVLISGPETTTINAVARALRDKLESIEGIDNTWLSVSRGQPELWVLPDSNALASFNLTVDQVAPFLQAIGREGFELPAGFARADGRELPLMVKRSEDDLSATRLERMRLTTNGGILPLAAVASVRRMPAQEPILHHNGRREISLFYRFDEDAPESGPARVSLEEQVVSAVRDAHRPSGTTVDLKEGSASVSWFRSVGVPALLLLVLVLAMTFESLTLPFLVLIALPLTLLGSTWALAISGLGLDPMAFAGALALLGLTINPAILLVDRMQTRFRIGGRSAGAAALAAVRERARPVLMTSATTIAALWPLALTTGRDNEIWPPFATIIMGGLATSTLLTLLVIPVGFVFLARLDRVFGRLGPWVVLGWIAATAGVIWPLVHFDLVSSLIWQAVTLLLVAGLFLGIAVLIFWRDDTPTPYADDGPPILSVRHLRKTYGEPGPVGRAWRQGGGPLDAREVWQRLLAFTLVSGGVLYLAVHVQTTSWRFIFLMIAAALVGRGLGAVAEIQKTNRVKRVAEILGLLLPWLAAAYFAWRHHLSPSADGVTPDVGIFWLAVIALGILLVQLGRRTARRIAQGEIEERLVQGRMRRVRTQWRRFSRRIFGLDLPRQEVRALKGVSFNVEGGMIGVLGPNGAGKTTLLRQLAGILDPSAGRILLGDVYLDKVRRFLARWVGYLPQDSQSTMPAGLTAREYLEYFALLYEIPAAVRTERINGLLKDVGLDQRADEKIGGYSGGMRQRVAVARTLLRLPPVIIVDEPTVGLDPRERIRFRNLLSKLSEGRIVLFSTHVVEDVAVACERVLVLARGELVFDGVPAELTAAAEGRVWELRLPEDEVETLPKEVRVADQVPEGGGISRLRLLSETRPHAAATAVEPSLEEGYLALVRGA